MYLSVVSLMPVKGVRPGYRLGACLVWFPSELTLEPARKLMCFAIPVGEYGVIFGWVLHLMVTFCSRKYAIKI